MQDVQNSQVDNCVWTKFIDEDQGQLDIFLSSKQINTNYSFLPISNNNLHLEIDEFFNQEKEKPDQQSQPPIKNKNTSQKLLIWEKEDTTQNRNALKFAIRVFIEYHINFDQSPDDLQRINDINHAYQRICSKNQGKINLTLQKYLFKESKFNLRNRQIFYEILNNKQILQKQLFFNGNVKHKKEYLIACKIMRLRSISAYLSERAQSR